MGEGVNAAENRPLGAVNSVFFFLLQASFLSHKKKITAKLKRQASRGWDLRLTRRVPDGLDLWRSRVVSEARTFALCAAVGGEHLSCLQLKWLCIPFSEEHGVTVKAPLLLTALSLNSSLSCLIEKKEKRKK